QPWIAGANERSARASIAARAKHAKAQPVDLRDAGGPDASRSRPAGAPSPSLSPRLSPPPSGSRMAPTSVAPPSPPAEDRPREPVDMSAFRRMQERLEEAGTPVVELG